MRQSKILLLLVLTHIFIAAFVRAQDISAPFPPLEQWKNTVLAGDVEGLKMLFSTQPAPQISTMKGTSDVPTEAAFWVGLKASRISFDITQHTSPQPGIELVVFQAEVQSSVAKDRTVYVSEAQAWQQQSGQWRLLLVKRSDPAHLKQPADVKKNLYPPDADAHAEIREAIEKAAKEHKRVLLVFGANWCFDCHVLDLAFQRPDLAPVVTRYEVVHIDIGDEGKKNVDIASQYHVPLEKGIPALAVLDSTGKLLVSQKNGEFEKARAMKPEDILDFLNKWKPEA